MKMFHANEGSFCQKICESKAWIAILAFTVLNLLLFVYNVCKLCKRRGPAKLSPSHNSQERTKKNMQIYISQHLGHNRDANSSVVIPSTLERSIDPFVPPTEYNLPEQVNCTTIFPHRKLFLGRIEWCGFEGFLKECANPLEMHLHRGLRHNNIVKFYWNNIADIPKVMVHEGMDMEKQLPISFYCMEYCPRGNLSGFLVSQGHVIEKKLLFGLISDITRGLQYLHIFKIAHRDIKSENILIQGLFDDPGRVVAKIADFDHAINTLNEFAMSHERNRKCQFGSPLYTAPEFILETIRQPCAADFFRHDIFSLGLVVWECLTWIKCRHHVRAEGAAHNPESLTEPLLPHPPSNENTTDIGQYRPHVRCSSTVHLPLVKQICDTLKLKYNRQQRELQVNNLFLKEGRLIDSKLMFEFYTKNPDARPVLFRDKGEGYTHEVNTVMEGCWRSEPAGRLSVDQVRERVDNICQTIDAT